MVLGRTALGAVVDLGGRPAFEPIDGHAQAESSVLPAALYKEDAARYAAGVALYVDGAVPVRARLIITRRRPD